MPNNRRWPHTLALYYTYIAYRDSANFCQILLTFAKFRQFLLNSAKFRQILNTYLYKQVAGTLQVSYRLFIYSQIYIGDQVELITITTDPILQPYSILVWVGRLIIYSQTYGQLDRVNYNTATNPMLWPYIICVVYMWNNI